MLDGAANHANSDGLDGSISNLKIWVKGAVCLRPRIIVNHFPANYQVAPGYGKGFHLVTTIIYFFHDPNKGLIKP